MKTKLSKTGYKMIFQEGKRWNERGMYWHMECKKCFSMTKVGSEDVTGIVCSKCVQKTLSGDID